MITLFRPQSSFWLPLRAVLPSFGLAAAFVVLGVAFFQHSQELMKSEIQAHLRTTAAVAASQFTAAELDRIRGREDLDTPLLRFLVQRLEDLKESIPNARYVYLMRRTSDANTLEFIADNDSLKPTAVLDENGDGVLQADEAPSWPGDPYDVSAIPALRDDAFVGPAVDDDVVEDQWGVFISGYAPIWRADGEVAGVIGIDIEASDYQRLITQVFSPMAMLLFILMGLAFAFYFFYLASQRHAEMAKRLHDIRTGIMQLTFHQLGSPLTAFKWSLELLKEHEAKEVPDHVIAEHIHVMEEGIAFMTHLVNDLERADRVREGHLDYSPELGDLSRTIRLVAADFASRAERRRQTIKLDLLPNIVLAFDHHLIGAVLRELIDNALIYSPNGSTVTVSLGCHDRNVEVSVTDQGIGIPKKEFDRVFAEFGRASNAGKSHPSGSGLALFIMKGIIERAGGEMTMQSIEGSGSTFAFTLPRE